MFQIPGSINIHTETSTLVRAASPGREAASKQAAACLLDSRSYGCLASSGGASSATAPLFINSVLTRSCSAGRIALQSYSSSKRAGYSDAKVLASNNAFSILVSRQPACF